MNLPRARDAFSLVLGELMFLALEALGLIGAAAIIKGLFSVLQWIGGHPLPAWLRLFPYWVEIGECLFFVVICGSLHLTRMGLHLKEIWAKKKEEGERLQEAEKERAYIIGTAAPEDAHDNDD